MELKEEVLMVTLQMVQAAVAAVVVVFGQGKVEPQEVVAVVLK
jgi:hypothetical protein